MKFKNLKKGINQDGRILVNKWGDDVSTATERPGHIFFTIELESSLEDFEKFTQKDVDELVEKLKFETRLFFERDKNVDQYGRKCYASHQRYTCGKCKYMKENDKSEVCVYCKKNNDPRCYYV